MTRGDARSSGPAYRIIVEADHVAPPAPLLEESYEWIEADKVDVARYVSQEYHDLEAQHLWPSSWQMACRLEHLPEVGSHVVYDICDQSIIVVRVSDTEIKAFHNACLHRGTTLVEGSGKVAFFKCPFHGFAWSIDGRFRGMPAPWDFPHVEAENFALPEAAVAVWGGFVMVNPDGTAPPFEEYAAPLTEHFAPYPLDGRYVAHHAAQVVEANWKTTQEAFMEGYHVSTTHPHTIRFANDFDCSYDVFGSNVSRLVQPIALPANHLIGQVSDEEMAGVLQRMLPKEDQREVPDDVEAREWLAGGFRDSFAKQWRTDLSTASESEMLDSIQYFVFPNFFPWAGYAIPIVYRFRPWDNDPNKSLMEIMVLHPVPDDGEYQTAEVHQLEPGETWRHAPGFELIGMVIDQDMDNLPRIQKGLRAASHRHITLSDYQEIRLRHFHRRLDQIIPPA
ncbi:MAG: phenylpropionate dioxygenase-like ring-hydroxylating dioxygenase large terminal subunit [Acidimicrobiales bacterium]|jgi:phenylpropionate dioxygenase-like ring-hydroxylating dioxygenase large terminal subunit